MKKTHKVQIKLLVFIIIFGGILGLFLAFTRENKIKSPMYDTTNVVNTTKNTKSNRNSSSSIDSQECWQLSVPTNLQAKQISITPPISVTWDQSPEEEVAGYMIEIYDSLKGKTIELIDVLGWRTTEYIWSNGEYGRSYEFSIYSYSTDTNVHESFKSEYVGVTISNQRALAPPIHFKGEQIPVGRSGRDIFKVSWNRNHQNSFDQIEGYLLSWRFVEDNTEFNEIMFNDSFNSEYFSQLPIIEDEYYGKTLQYFIQTISKDSDYLSSPKTMISNTKIIKDYNKLSTPTDIRVKQVGDSSDLEIIWDSTNDRDYIDGHILEIQEITNDDSPSKFVTVPGSETFKYTYNQSNYGRSYRVLVKAYSDDPKIEDSDESYMVKATVERQKQIPTPTNLTAIHIPFSNNVRLLWDYSEREKVEKYILSWREKDSGSEYSTAVIDNGNITEHLLKDLSYEKSYEFFVEAKSNNSIYLPSNPSAVKEFKIDEKNNKLAVPTNLNIEQVGDSSSMRITWNQNFEKQTDGYKLEILDRGLINKGKNDDNFPGSTFIEIPGRTTTEYVYDLSEYGHRYYFFLNAYSLDPDVIPSEQTNHKEFIIPTEKQLESPINLQAKQLPNTTDVKISWEQKNREKVAKYVLSGRLKNSGDKYQQVEINDRDKTEYTVKNLKHGHGYEFLLEAKSNDDYYRSSEKSMLNFTLEKGPLGVPTNLRAEQIGESSAIRVLWDKANDEHVDGYIIDYSNGNGFISETISDDPTSDTMEYIIKEAKYNETFTFAVKSTSTNEFYNTESEGVESEFTVGAAPQLVQESLIKESNTDTSLVVSWDWESSVANYSSSVEDEQIFDVNIHEANVGSREPVGEMEFLEKGKVRFTGLNPSTLYSINITLKNDSDNKNKLTNQIWTLKAPPTSKDDFLNIGEQAEIEAAQNNNGKIINNSVKIWWNYEHSGITYKAEYYKKEDPANKQLAVVEFDTRSNQAFIIIKNLEKKANYFIDIQQQVENIEPFVTQLSFQAYSSSTIWLYVLLGIGIILTIVLILFLVV